MGATVIGQLCHAGPMLNCLAKKVLDRTLKKRAWMKTTVWLFWASFSQRLNNHQSAFDQHYSSIKLGWATEEHLLGKGGLGCPLLLET